MVASRTAARGLSTQDVESIRAQLASGRRPKVVFTEAAGQIAGQTGQVVQLTDPDGAEEFVVVRFGRDELPFSPTDVMIPPRGGTTRRAEPRPAADAKPADTEPAADGPVGVEPPAGARSGSGTETAAGTEAAAKTPPAARQAAKPDAGDQPTQQPARTPREEPSMPRSTVDKPTPPAAAAPATAPGGAAPDGAAAARPRKAAKQARPKAPAGLTVTLSYTDGDWMVAANQGSRSLAKPYLIKASEALKMVGMLDVPGVQEAVEQIVSAEREEAQQQAQRLRAELAEIEAKLADLTDLR